MKTIYMECTLNIMSRAEVEMKELPNGNKYLVIVTNPE